MSEFGDAIAEHIRRIQDDRARAIEEACEQALQDGRYGVRVETVMHDQTVTVTAHVDPSVPYGYIHEYHHSGSVSPSVRQWRT